MSAEANVSTLMIDGHRDQRPGGPDHPRSGAREQHVDSDAVPSGRTVGCRRVPGVPGGGEGARRLFPACVTRVEEGMEVTTQSPNGSTDYRQMILEMFFAERNHICSVCVANGHCELQSRRRRWA